jgi:hypothetical protein
VFAAEMSSDSIRKRVEERIDQFGGRARAELKLWETLWFRPVIDRLEAEGLGYLSWEELLDAQHDEELNTFYTLCKKHNQPAAGCPQGATQKPLRGREYFAPGPEGAIIRVRVCNPGQKNSSVVSSDGQGEIFSRANDTLIEIREAEQHPAPLDPAVGREYDWLETPGKYLPVRVIGLGPCRSRVRRSDGVGGEFLAPNHRLFPRACGNQTEG